MGIYLSALTFMLTVITFQLLTPFFYGNLALLLRHTAYFQVLLLKVSYCN